MWTIIILWSMNLLYSAQFFFVLLMSFAGHLKIWKCASDLLSEYIGKQLWIIVRKCWINSPNYWSWIVRIERDFLFLVDVNKKENSKMFHDFVKMDAMVMLFSFQSIAENKKISKKKKNISIWWQYYVTVFIYKNYHYTTKQQEFYIKKKWKK